MLLKPEDRAEKPPEWVTKATEEAAAAEEVAAEAVVEPAAAGLPDWLTEEEEPQPDTAAEIALPAAEIAAPAAEIAADAAEVEKSSGEMDADAAFAWLESLAVKQGADQALLLKPEDRAEKPPEWVTKATEDAAAEDAGAAEAVTAEAAAAEAAVASTAAGLPDWLTDKEEPEPESAAPPAPAVETAALEPAVEAALPDWLTEEEEIAVQEEIQPAVEEAPVLEPAPAAPARSLRDELPEGTDVDAFEDAMDWLQGLMTLEEEPRVEEQETEARLETVEPEPVEALPIAQQPPEHIPAAEKPQPPSGEMDGDAAFAWLESLAVKQGADQALLLKPEDRAEKPPEWVTKATEDAAAEAAAAEDAAAETAAAEAAALAEAATLGAAPPQPTIETPPQTAPAAFQPPSGEMDGDAAFAWLESLAVKQGADQALLLKPEDRAEKPPEWVTKATEAAAAEAAAAEDAAAETAAAEAAALAEAATLGAAPPQPMIETAPAAAAPQPPSNEMDADAAFAWLESLAVKQGADQALLLKPEERSDLPPDWVVKAASEPQPEPVYEAETEAKPEPVEAEPAEEIPAWVTAEEVEPQVKAAEPPPAAGAIPSMPSMFAEEPPVTQQAPARGPETIRLPPVPDLPSWLAEEISDVGEELEWTPPPTPARQLDLNQASLAELERLPGIGFIMAQMIVNYREENGPFRDVDDLIRVPGFSPATLEDIRPVLLVEKIDEPVIPDLPPLFRYMEDIDEDREDLPSGIVAARLALNQGDLDEASSRYNAMIRDRHALPLVIEDLQEVLNRYPKEARFWQFLGDAYIRSDHIQEAMQAYTKAEEILR